MSKYDRQRIVVVGAGLAGARVCEQLRRQGYVGHLTLLGREAHAPYDRPPLSKAVLRGDLDRSTLKIDLDSLNVELLLDEEAHSLDVSAQSIVTTQRRVQFDGLVVASGADPIRLPGDGPQTTLRTIDDALNLRHALKPASSVAVVGAGWIGAEVATAAQANGCAVTCIEAGRAPVSRAMGNEVGHRLASWWQGIELRTETGVSHVKQGGLVLDDGTELDADLVLTGIGVRPATTWLADSGIDVDRGVIVDEHLRAARGVVALGDVVARWSPRYGQRMRVEHWENATSSARVAASTLLRDICDPSPPVSDSETYDPVPYFWSNQFGHKVQYAGQHDPDDRMTWRESPAEHAGWSAVWRDATGRLAAVLAVDWPAEMAAARRALATGGRPDEARLANSSVALTEL
jgi:3-phenylpropionate/trans-cinnamate dioxygenase ferredoxin reductase subunit